MNNRDREEATTAGNGGAIFLNSLPLVLQLLRGLLEYNSSFNHSSRDYSEYTSHYFYYLF